ncbi:predicted protein [Plenodomus lingam JN3]|uniref:Predicted protein n=1 Tax=Leptosphaeria maculans (strain JN3 / isolate v23.1.3 / race Av1-4-5-6-7-8) TaxID=985895 RepID=E5A402_LEPMJ|nr:predicted protein [Plenodomus lingam JN3]CBX98347.1 predicted protein [Plenodomus lingam JN3]
MAEELIILSQCAPWFQLNVSTSHGQEPLPENNDADPWLIENTGKNYSQHAKVGYVNWYKDYQLVTRSPRKG